MKDINNQKYRTRISFSSKFKSLYDNIGCGEYMITSYFEGIFRRKNSSSKRKLNGKEEVKSEYTDRTRTIGLYFIEDKILWSLFSEYPSCMKTYIENGTIEQCTDGSNFYKIKIPNHNKNVIGRLYFEKYRLYKNILNDLELEVFMRVIVENSNGAYFSFSRSVIFEIMTRSNDIDNETGVIVENNVSTTNKRINRMVNKLIKANVLNEYGVEYSNAPTQFEYEMCTGETEIQWREEISSELNRCKNRVFKLENELIEKDLLIESMRKIIVTGGLGKEVSELLKNVS